MIKYRVFNIDYDTSDTDQDAMEGVALPSEMVVEVDDVGLNNLYTYLEDKVSDITHFCVNGLEYEMVG